MPWKDVNIERLSLPGTLSLLIGWTGQAASTDSLVNQVGQGRSQDGERKQPSGIFAKSSPVWEASFRPASRGMERFQAVSLKIADCYRPLPAR